MALIKCPKCGKEVSDRAKQCPNCGCPEPANQPTVAKEEEKELIANGRAIRYPNCGCSDTSNSPSPTVNEIRYEVNPDAERVANSVAQALLWVHLILGIGSIVVGIVLGIEDDELLFALIPIGVAFVLIGIIVWASIKLFVNISRNLYNINDSIQRLKALLEKK